MLTRILSALAGLGLLYSLVACAVSEPEATSTPTVGPTPTLASTLTPTPTSSPASGTAPFHAVPPDASVVWGTAVCGLSDAGVDPDGGAGFLAICELDMSDPRVSGTERVDYFRSVGETPGGRAWIAEKDVITNAEGTWRGSAQAAENVAAIPAGEAHFVGEGAYEGLEFHYYFFHPDLAEKAQLNGWISAAQSVDPATSTVEAAPFHAMPKDALAVSGTAACEFTDEGVDPDGGSGFLATCTLGLSDPRVAGTERQDRFRFVVGRIGAGDVWVSEEASITNQQGSWLGSVQAVENDEAIPAGEAHYVGEGAYAGLEFHYYFFHSDIATDGPAQVRGWISDGG